MELNGRKRWIRGLAVLGLALTSTGWLSAEETYQLRYKFTPDQVLSYVSQNDAALVIQHDQTREEPRHTEMMIRTMRVTSVGPDGVANLDLSIDRAYMTATSDGETVVYNSDHPEKASEEFAEVNEATRKPIQMRVTSLGKGLPLEGQADAVSNDLLILLPEEAVSVGGTWKEKFESGVQIDAKTEKLMRPLKMERRFTLKSVEGDIATIAMTTECLSPRVDPFQESQVMQRKPAGTLKFDIARGCLVDRDMRIDQRSVGFQGVGTSMTIRTVKIDRLIAAEEASKFNLHRPLLSVQTAFGAAAAAR